MLYWYTGQPGHGKTLHALDRAIEMKADADKKHAQNPGAHPLRPLYICNVRDMQFAKVGAIELLPDRFKGWADSPEYRERLADITERFKPALAGARNRDARNLVQMDMDLELEDLHKEKCASEEIDPDFQNAIILIDEAYEHGIFPKRAPGAPVPRHVERVAKHRHYGIDFVCVSQSPDKQCDQFLQDLIERHIHVRRRFGTQYVHLREFDKFTANAEKAIPLVNRRGMLPKKPRGLYKSTQLDTTERKIPWYYVAFFLGVPLGLWLMYSAFGKMGTNLGGEAVPAPVPTVAVTAGQTPKDNGASATVADGAAPAAAEPRTILLTDEQLLRMQEIYAQQFRPLVASQPWTAPAYNGKLTLGQDPPRIFCSVAAPGESVDLVWQENSQCSCLTEQGTTYLLDMVTCVDVATKGQYEPYRQERNEQQGLDGYAQQERFSNDARLSREARGIGAPRGEARYGEFRDEPRGPDGYEGSEW